jgi:signal transduction histidine kinase
VSGDGLDRRQAAVDRREEAAQVREDAVGVREQTQRDGGETPSEIESRYSELRQANEHLVIATLAAKELSEAAALAHQRQDEFLAMLAHELRNPLAPIRSAVALLARLDAAAAPTLPVIRAVIQRQVEHMARLLDDLLDVSRITSGKVQLQREPTPVAAFVEQAVETCRALIDAQHQTLTLEMPATPVDVDGDPMRLAQIVSNLLHNAAKYTQEGGAITVEARRAGETVVIRVSDNGAGISADALPHVFDLFTQDARSLSRSQGGLGIGLTVVRSMVERHRGTVEARSGGLGQGSEFIVTLPCIEHATASPALEVTAAAAAAVRILVVDDNVDAGVVMAMLLRLSGHEVTVALDGPTALRAYAQVRPQVVLCDIGLPGMTGYEVAAKIREGREQPRPLLIALTGYGGPKDRQRALAAGFDHHLVKPTDPEALLRLIPGAAP